MSTRRAKQLIYGVFYALIWLTFFYGIYFVFLRPALPSGPTCGDFCPPPGVKPIALQGAVSDFVTAAGRHTFLAQIANVNNDYAGKAFVFTFTAYRADDSVIQTFVGDSFIYSNEIKYLIAANESVSEPIDHIGLTITNVQWVPGNDLGVVPQLALQNEQSSAGSNVVTVSGELTNNDIAPFDQVTIIGIFKGVDGSPIGASQTEVDGLNAGDSANFSVMYPAVQGINPSSYQVFAYALRR